MGPRYNPGPGQGARLTGWGAGRKGGASLSFAPLGGMGQFFVPGISGRDEMAEGAVQLQVRYEQAAPKVARIVRDFCKNAG